MSEIIIKIRVTDPPAKDKDAHMASYIYDALRTMGGCLRPSDPFFSGLHVEAVTIRGSTYVITDKTIEGGDG